MKADKVRESFCISHIVALSFWGIPSKVEKHLFATFR